MPRQFPELFAILRDGFHNPCLQLLRSHEQRSRRDCYEIVNVANTRDYDGNLIQVPLSGIRDREVRTLHYVNPETGEESEVYYWFTSFVIEYDDRQVIPLLEFQYRSWLPTGYNPLPIRTNIHELYSVLSSIQQERLSMIRQREDTEAMRDAEPYYSPRNYDSPRLPLWMRNWDNDRRRSLRTPSPVRPPTPRVVETVRLVEVPVERVVVQHRVLPLPKEVGNILLLHARKGPDACPIAATPFSECESLCVSSCFHIFDTASLSRWRESHTSCPVCRSKIENVVVEERHHGVPTM